MRVLILLLLLAGLTGVTFTILISRFGDRVQREAFETYTATAAAALEPDVVAGIEGSARDEGTAAFEVVRGELRRVLAAAPHARFVYLVAKRDGRWIFLADAEDPTSPDYSPPGSIYEGDVTGFERVLAAGQPDVDGPSADKWGIWVTGEAPILDPRTHRLIAVFGIDIAAAAWAGEVQRYRWFGIAGSSLLVALILVGGIGLNLRSNRRQMELHLASIVRSAQGAVIGGDTSGLITSWNPAAEKMFGYRPSEIIGRPADLLAPKDRKQEVRQQVERILRGESLVDFETVRVRKDGRTIDVFETISPIFDPAGRVVGASAFIFDIGEKRRTEERLRVADRIVDNSSAVLYRTNLGSGMEIAFVSSNVRKFGYRPEQLVGRQVTDIVHPDDADRVVKEISDFVASGADHSTREYRMRAGDGSYRWFRDHCAVLRTDGKPTALEGVVVDITERRTAEAAIHESEDRYRNLVESTTDYLWEIDAKGAYTYVSPAIRAMLGYEPREIVGKTPFDLMAAAEAARVRAWFAPVEAAREPLSQFENTVLHRNGTEVVLETSAIPVFDKDGTYKGYRGIDRDITARKRAQTALLESQRLIEGILNAITTRVFWKNKNLVYLGCNAVFARDAGFADPRDVVGKDDYQMAWRDQAEAYRKDDQQVIESGQAKILFEEPQTTPDGRSITLLTSKIPLRNEKGEIEGVLGTYMDITEYKQAVDARQASEERYRILFETTPEAILTLEPPSWHFKSANPAAVKLYGANSEAQLVAHGPWEPSPERQPDGRLSTEKAREMIEKAMREGSHFFEWTHRRMDGTEFPTDVLLTRTDQGGKAVIYATVRDITERKLAEETRAQLAAVVESSRTGIIGVDLDGIIKSWNEGAARIYGYSAEEIVGRSVEILYGPDFTMGTRERLRKIESGQEPITRELVRIRKDGRKVDILQTFSPVLDSAGKLIGASSVNLDITDRKEAERSLERVTQTLKTLSRANEALIRATSQEMLFDSMCRIAVESGGYRMAWVGVAEQDADKTVRPVAWAGHVDGYLDGVAITWADAPRGRGPIGIAIRTGEVQVEQDIEKDPRMAPWRDAALKRGYRSSIALPLREGSSVIGALSIYAAEPEALGSEEVHLLMELANDISFGLTALRTRADRESAMARLERSVEETVQAVASTVEMRDAYTAGHQRRVTIIAEAIARELGLPAEKIRGLRMASMVHDLGKINIPAEILSKPSKLSPIEFRIIKTHPQVGYDILKPVEFPWPIADIVLQHHERMDGSGYPKALKGDQILLEARVLAVADVVEAMMSHRPFRPALGLEVALDEIRQGSGRLYDPAVVQACLKVMRDGRLDLEPARGPERVRPPAGD